MTTVLAMATAIAMVMAIRHGHDVGHDRHPHPTSPSAGCLPTALQPCHQVLRQQVQQQLAAARRRPTCTDRRALWSSMCTWTCWYVRGTNRSISSWCLCRLRNTRNTYPSCIRWKCSIPINSMILCCNNRRNSNACIPLHLLCKKRSKR